MLTFSVVDTVDGVLEVADEILAVILPVVSVGFSDGVVNAAVIRGKVGVAFLVDTVLRSTTVGKIEASSVTPLGTEVDLLSANAVDDCL